MRPAANRPAERQIESLFGREPILPGFRRPICGCMSRPFPDPVRDLPQRLPEGRPMALDLPQDGHSPAAATRQL
jgi:hypothetical protein